MGLIYFFHILMSKRHTDQYEFCRKGGDFVLGRSTLLMESSQAMRSAYRSGTTHFTMWSNFR